MSRNHLQQRNDSNLCLPGLSLWDAILIIDMYINIYIYTYLYIIYTYVICQFALEVSTASVGATNDTVRIEHWHYQPFEGLKQFET